MVLQSNTGQIILQAAQGIVAQQQRARELELRRDMFEQQVEQQEAVFSLREQGLKLQQEQLELSKQREARLGEAADVQQRLTEAQTSLTEERARQLREAVPGGADAAEFSPALLERIGNEGRELAGGLALNDALSAVQGTTWVLPEGQEVIVDVQASFRSAEEFKDVATTLDREVREGSVRDRILDAGGIENVRRRDPGLFQLFQQQQQFDAIRRGEPKDPELVGVRDKINRILAGNLPPEDLMEGFIAAGMPPEQARLFAQQQGQIALRKIAVGRLFPNSSQELRVALETRNLPMVANLIRGAAPALDTATLRPYAAFLQSELGPDAAIEVLSRLRNE